MTSLETIQRTYTAIWKRAQRQEALLPKPINVSYATRYALTDGGGIAYEGGMFHDRTCSEPYDDALRFEPHWHRGGGELLTPNELCAELYVLAHEYGHLLSFEAGTWTEHEPHLRRFSDALKARTAIDVRDLQIIVVEERRAWKSGRAELELLGWTDLVSFDARADAAVETYENLRTTA